MTTEAFEIFLVATPGLETALVDEAAQAGFEAPRILAGGVAIMGGWKDVWRANLELRGATRVLARLGAFRAPHLAQLDKRARKFPWGEFLPKGATVSVEASCKASRIYHSKAAEQRIATALAEEFGAKIAAQAPIAIMARIEDDLCTISVDTSGELLHKRGHKQAMAKAPMRETMAAMFLRQCGYDGTMPLLDPMCGSGTFVIEAAEMAAGLKPGRARHFAFEQLKSFDAKIWAEMHGKNEMKTPAHMCFGRDLDPGSIRMSRENAARANVENFTQFSQCDIRDLTPPEGPTGLVIINPPYGTRIGEKRGLNALHATLGYTLRTRFQGWRVGLITSDNALAGATDLPFAPAGPPVSHGGLKVKLYQALIT